MTHALHDRLSRPTGVLTLRIKRRGVPIEEVRENLVVDASKFMLSRLLGGTVSNNSVAQIGFGTGNSAALAGNTTLTGAYLKAIASATFPSNSQVQFNFTLGTGEANGMGIWEFGLLSGANTLFSRVVRSSVLNKAADISLSGAWLISF